MDYNGIKCPVCDKPFSEDSDIVVCPICGAPYHRGCYQEKGSCIFTELHEEHRTWLPPAAPQPHDTTSEIKDKECPRCGTLNAHSALFCNLCGASLSGEPEEYKNTGHQTTNPTYHTPPSPGPMPFGFGGVPFMADPMGGVNPAEPLDEGVTFGDASKVVQQNTSYYMTVFHRIRTQNKSKFNFCAFLFSGGWFLYRKQYKTGIVLSVSMLVLYLTSMLLSYLYILPLMTNAITTLGISDSSTAIYQAAEYMVDYLMQNPGEIFLFYAPFLCYLAMFGIMLFCGIRANRLYLKHCVRTVREIKETSHTESDQQMEYTAKGGINPAVAFLLMAVYMMLRWIPLFLY